mmetsp:Transcript_13747/g.22589  ORF Transcript_13747/g.22589 Transcript_13747/m.22589 type:complete len:521 (+) Transcript_13747:97-1659(+)
MSSLRGRVSRSLSLPATFSYRKRDGSKQLKKKRSLQEKKSEVLDDTGSEESLPPPPASGVMISVHDEVVHKTVTMPITEEGPLGHYEDSGPSCFCMTDEHLFPSLIDEFFSHQPEPQAYYRQESNSSSSSSYDEVTTQIECILQAAYAEDKEELIEDEDVKIPPQIDVSAPAGQPSLPCLLKWKQHPLLLTATPNSGMAIRGIRRLSDPSFFDDPVNSEHTNDNDSLMQLPINNGKEQPGQSLVIDFETELFAGTALFRIRDCCTDALSIEDSSVNSKHDYFGDKNRKYQVCIRGRFKQKVVMATCMSGLLLDRPLVISRKVNSNAPPRWILRAAVRIANILSPRMDAELECAHPRVLSPLCSTAQTIWKHVQKEDPVLLDESYEEPHPDSSSSLVADLKKRGADESDANYAHAQYRKRTFNNIYDDYVQSNSNESPLFDDSEYTFEFLQHLVDYNDLSLDLGRAMGKIKLGAGLRGQPVRITAISNAKDEQGEIPRAVISEKTSLWAFDLWHASNVLEE